MRYIRKIIYFLLVLIVVGLLGNWALNFWIDRQLPSIISEKNDSPYSITYKKADVSLWNTNIKAFDVTIIPKKALADTGTKAGIYATVGSVEIQNFKIWNLLFDNKIKARKIIIHKPTVLLYKKNKKVLNNSKNLNDEVVRPFGNIIVVPVIHVQKGSLKVIYVANNKPIFSVININMALTGIIITDETLQQKIPFLFEDYKVGCDSLYYRPNDFYHVTASKVKVDTTDVTTTAFALVPEYTRPEFVKRIKKETDLFFLQSDSISLKNIKWGFAKNRLFFEVKNVEIHQMFANIYRNKMPKDDLSKKHLYNKLLRDLSFRLKVDTLKIKNSLLKYEEEIDFRKGPGTLTFNRFNLTATNIQSGYGVTKLPDLNIAISCHFMNTSPMKVHWKLNVMDKSDGFVINGSILNFNARQIDRFTKPYINAKMNGVLEKVYFNFVGNDKVSKGDFALQYHDFKVTLYRKKKPEKKNVFVTALGNLLAKNDSDGTVKETKVTVERIPEKSFYNLLWRSIADGLRQIIL